MSEVIGQDWSEEVDRRMEQQAFIDETSIRFNLLLTVIPFCHQCKRPLRVALRHIIDSSTVSIHIVPCENCTVNYAPPTDRKELW